MSGRQAQRWVFLGLLGLGLLLGTSAEARFPHGGWVSRDLELVGDVPVVGLGETISDASTLWVVSMENGDGEGQMTAWSFCTAEDPATCQQVCTDGTDRSTCAPGNPDCQACSVPADLTEAVQACTPPCKTRHISPSEDQQLYTSPGVSPDGRWVMYGTKDQALHSVYWADTGEWVSSSWSLQAVLDARCKPERPLLGGGPAEGRYCKLVPLRDERGQKVRDENGDLVMVYKAKATNDEKKWFAQGFHSRPLYLDVPLMGKIFVAVNIGNNSEAYLHIYKIENDRMVPSLDPILIPDAQQNGYLFDLIAHEIAFCEFCQAGDTDCEQECGTKPDVIRVYLAADDSDKKAEFPVRAVGFSEFDCGGAGLVPCFVQESSGEAWTGPKIADQPVREVVDAIKPGARLGGLVMEDVTLAQGATSDLLIYNLNDGVIAMSLEPENWGEKVWYRFLQQVHRTKPTLSQTARDENKVSPNNPVLYLGQRQGGVCKGGQARVYRLDPGTGLPSNAAEDAQNDSGQTTCPEATAGLGPGDKLNDDECVAKGYLPGENQPRPMFPGCYDEKIGNASFSSPMVNPVSGHVFFGPAHAGDPIYKVDPRDPQRKWTWDSQNETLVEDEKLHNYSRVGWLDYAPTNGWRTNAAFSDDGHTMFVGSAGGIVYALDADEPCGVVRWCFDTRKDGDIVRDEEEELDSVFTLNGGYCDRDAAGGGTDYADIPCCAALLDDDAKSTPYRRMAKQCATCWNAANEQTDCKIARVAMGSGSPYYWNGAQQDPGSENYYDVERRAVVVDFGAADTRYDCEHDTWIATFGLELNEIDHALSGAAVARGEAMNEDTGEIFDTVQGAVASRHEAQVHVEEIGGNTTNTIRFALFDEHGNESMVRVDLGNIPASDTSSCPTL